MFSLRKKKQMSKKRNNSLHYKGRDGPQGMFCHLPLQAFNQCGKKKNTAMNLPITKQVSLGKHSFLKYHI